MRFIDENILNDVLTEISVRQKDVDKPLVLIVNSQ